jgi:hypothetical protein
LDDVVERFLLIVSVSYLIQSGEHKAPPTCFVIY